MAKFNVKKGISTQTVTNMQGGTGFKYNDKSELVAILATGLDSSFFEKENERSKRFEEVLNKVAKQDPIFAAKAMIYARTKFGQRSITHLGSAIMAKYLSGNSIAAKFYTKRDKKQNFGGVVYRLDDMNEILAAYQLKNPTNKTRKSGGSKIILPNAIKKGFKDALENADSYEIAKYQTKSRNISLVDIVNLVRPKPTSKEMEGVFKQLMEGTLKQFNTVEDKNTKTGQEVAAKVKSGELNKNDAERVLQEAKEENYIELITTRKIGYLALLRNLRNILKNTSDSKLINAACELLVDQKLIKQSLVWPHQIDLALEIMLLEFSPSQMGKLANALNTAYELAIPNLSDSFPGKTAVVFDSSGSMHSTSYGGAVSNGDSKNKKTFNKTPIEKAALIGATLAKGIGADLFQFGSTCAAVRYNPNDSMNTIKNIGLSQNGKVGHGTSFDSIFQTLKGYDRIFIISDLQGGDSIVRGSSYQTYKQKYGSPYIYTIDIVGCGTNMFKQDSKLMQLYGYSAAIYESIKSCELDTKQVIKEIEAINI